MEIRSLKIDRPEEPPQGFLSYCLEGIGRARQEMGWPSRIDSPLDNFLNMHLAQILTLGLYPPQQTVAALSSGPSAVCEFLGRQPNHHRHYQTCLELGEGCLYFHSQGLPKLARPTGRWASVAHWNTWLTHIGQDCYFLAGRQLPDEDLLGAIWIMLSKDFKAYSRLLHEAGVELGFTDNLPPGLISQ